MKYTSLVTALIAGSCLALAACGTATNNPISTLALGLSSSLKSGSNANAAVERQLNRDVLNRIKNPFLLAELPLRGTKATLAPAAQNREHVTWIGGDGVGIVFKGALVTRTQGLGDDLLTLETGGGVEAAIRRGSGSATRVHRYLNGETHVFARKFTCTYTSEGQEIIEIVGRGHATRRVIEDCAGGGIRFQNRYWLGVGDGFVWKSEQWISPKVGHLVVSRLVR